MITVLLYQTHPILHHQLQLAGQAGYKSVEREAFLSRANEMGFFQICQARNFYWDIEFPLVHSF